MGFHIFSLVSFWYLLMVFHWSGYRVHVHAERQLLSLMRSQVNRWCWMPARATSVHLTKVCFLCNLGALLWIRCTLYLLYLSYANTVWVHYWTVSPWVSVHLTKMKRKITCIFCILLWTTRSSKVFHSQQFGLCKIHLIFLFHWLILSKRPSQSYLRIMMMVDSFRQVLALF